MKFSKSIIWLGIMLSLSIVIFSSCSHDMNHREIDEINFVLVMGIDYDGEQYTITTVHSLGIGEGVDEPKEEITEGSGKTPYEAFQALRLKNKKTVSVANIGYILLGEQAAKQGLGEALDYFSREQSIKMESLVYVTMNKKAADFIQEAKDREQMINEDLETMEEKQSELVTRNDNTLVNVFNEMFQTNSSVLLPYLVSEENIFILRGYSVFDQLKLKDYLDEDTSSGINFVKGIIREYPIYLEDKVGLELSFSSTKKKSKLDSSQVTVEIHIDFETMIKEVSLTGNVFTMDRLQELTDEQNQYVYDIVKRAVDYSKTTGLDIMNIARLVENQHYRQWEELEKTWKDSIATVDYDIIVNSKISKSFILGNEK